MPPHDGGSQPVIWPTVTENPSTTLRSPCNHLTMDESWRDPTAAWWAKSARALKHVGDACLAAAEYEQEHPYEVRRETTDRPGEVAFRFHLLKPVPVELLTIIGDAVHNMRSCLDSVAFELARQHLGGAMTDKQERAAQFPIVVDRGEFDEFFGGHKLRRQMYGQRELDTMRCVQPFAIREEAAEYEVDWTTSPEEEYRINELARLNHISNVDKHRRLPVLSWYLDIVYWAGEAPGITWRTDRKPFTAIGSNDIIGYLTTISGDISQVPEPVIQLQLALADDPGYPHDLMNVLERWHQYLVGWALPRMFAVADGNPPPILIMG